ncbi:MAG: sulfatase-like hydrolase/transferase [Candidatus Aminicenantes bacterium]|nr:sulfatase-like hydrolase/transferase [Candidatus Aminicenantes bacterium]
MNRKKREASAHPHSLMCLLGAFIFLLMCMHESASAEMVKVKKDGSLNILLIIIDTLRADRVGFSGYDIETPHMDSLAFKGTSFTDATCQYPMTLPSHASIMTGTFPQFHGIRSNGNYYLKKDFITLAEVLKTNGFVTSAFIASVVLDSKYGLSQGFDHYDDTLKTPDYLEDIESQSLAQDVYRSAKNWFDSNHPKKFFMWVHFYDPHAPYLPPSPFDKKYENPYDGEVAYTDVYVGKLIDMLKEKGVYKNTLIVLTGDHGEGLGEHNELTHAIFLYDTTVKVPLLFHCPGFIPQGSVLDGPARTVDIMPTILDMLKIKNPDSVQGRSLIPMMEKKKTGELFSYAETYFPFLSNGWAPLKCLRDKGFKFIKAPKPELYDLSVDPEELHNILNENPQTARKMLKQLDEFEAKYQAEKTVDKRHLSLEERESLESLGYVEFFDEEDLKKTGLADPKDKIQLFNRIQTADDLLGERKFEEAQAILNSVLLSDPGNPGIHYLLAQTHFENGRYEDAVSELIQVLEVNKRNTTAFLQLGLCYLNLGRLTEAEKEFDVVFHLTPEDVDSLSVIATAFREKGDLIKSREYIERAVALDGENLKLRLQLAEVLEMMQEDEKALLEFESVLAKDPGNAQAYLGLGLYHLNRGDLERGISRLERSLSLSPSPLVYFSLGLAYKMVGREQEALKMLQKYLEAAPASEAERKKIAQSVIDSIKDK